MSELRVKDQGLVSDLEDIKFEKDRLESTVSDLKRKNMNLSSEVD